MSEYLTTEARKSAIKDIGKCIEAIMEDKEIDLLSADRTIKYLVAYRNILRRELNPSEYK